MNKMTLIPDADFYDISKKVKELRNTIYSNKQVLKIDFITLIFARIDELLKGYSDELNNNSNSEKFIEIKNALNENCNLLNTALKINEIDEIKEIAYKKVNKLQLLGETSFDMFDCQHPTFSMQNIFRNNELLKSC